MKNNYPIPENLIICPDSQIIYSSSVGVGQYNDEIRLILINKRLITDEDDIKIVNESNFQVILNRSTAMELKNILEDYLD